MSIELAGHGPVGVCAMGVTCGVPVAPAVEDSRVWWRRRVTVLAGVAAGMLVLAGGSPASALAAPVDGTTSSGAVAYSVPDPNGVYGTLTYMGSCLAADETTVRVTWAPCLPASSTKAFLQQLWKANVTVPKGSNTNGSIALENVGAGLKGLSNLSPSVDNTEAWTWLGAPNNAVPSMQKDFTAWSWQTNTILDSAGTGEFALYYPKNGPNNEPCVKRSNELGRQWTLTSWYMLDHGRPTGPYISSLTQERDKSTSCLTAPISSGFTAGQKFRWAPVAAFDYITGYRQAYATAWANSLKAAVAAAEAHARAYAPARPPGVHVDPILSASENNKVSVSWSLGPTGPRHGFTGEVRKDIPIVIHVDINAWWLVRDYPAYDRQDVSGTQSFTFTDIRYCGGSSASTVITTTRATTVPGEYAFVVNSVATKARLTVSTTPRCGVTVSLVP